MRGCGVPAGRVRRNLQGKALAVVKIRFGTGVAQCPVAQCLIPGFDHGGQAQIQWLTGTARVQSQQGKPGLKHKGFRRSMPHHRRARKALRSRRRLCRGVANTLSAEAVAGPLARGRKIEFLVGSCAALCHKSLKAGVLPQAIGSPGRRWLRDAQCQQVAPNLIPKAPSLTRMCLRALDRRGDRQRNAGGRGWMADQRLWRYQPVRSMQVLRRRGDGFHSPLFWQAPAGTAAHGLPLLITAGSSDRWGPPRCGSVGCRHRPSRCRR